MEDILEMHFDKTKISVSNLFDNSDERQYWLSRTPQERLVYMEQLRRMNYGSEATKPIEKTVFEVVQVNWK